MYSYPCDPVTIFDRLGTFQSEAKKNVDMYDFSGKMIKMQMGLMGDLWWTQLQ